jgi:polysaccharide chain length determinant protein (PEP-CTERM system associated)
MLWKQKLPVVAVWLLLAAGTVALVAWLPPVYRAETLILVDSQKIPEKFVSATVSTDLRELLAALSLEILSSPRLMKIIETFDLYPQERRDLSVEEVLEKMRRAVDIRVEKGWTDHRPGAFRVSFEGKNPAVVAEVTNQLGNLFVDENLRSREVHAEGTLEFIQSQLEQAKKKLDEEEKRVSEYKLEHNGELPEQAAALTASLSQFGVQFQGNQEAISRSYTNQVTLQSGLRLAQTVAEVSERLNRRAEEKKGTDDERPGSLANSPSKILEAMEAEVASLLTRYTEAHPRVRLLRASIARLKALEEREQLAAAVDPQQTERLKAQLAAADREINERQQENQYLIQEIQATQSRLRRVPIREQEMAALTRDYEISKANYKSLLDKFYAAEMANDMERRQKAERFTVLEPARVPQRPVKPTRQFLAGIGCLLALVASVVAGFVWEIKKNTILGEWEVPASIPVQGRVPSIGNGASASPGIRVCIQAQGRVARLLRPVVDRAADSARANGGFLTAPNVYQQTNSGIFPQLLTGTALEQTQVLRVPCRRSVKSVRPASAAICLHNADARALEQYRIVRTKIGHHPLQPKLVVVTSACAGDGKTITATNLATVFALRSDVQVLLVEADFRRSRLSELLGVPAQPGVADVLGGKCELSEAMVCLEQLPNLCLLPAGTFEANPAEWLDTPAWQAMCSSFREQFAFTLFDAPPVAAVADYELIEKNCDGVIMVVRPDRTDRSLFRRAHELVSPDKMLGVLINGANDWFLWKTAESYYDYSEVRS